jgi:hypothetical protein
VLRRSFPLLKLRGYCPATAYRQAVFGPAEGILSQRRFESRLMDSREILVIPRSEIYSRLICMHALA